MVRHWEATSLEDSRVILSGVITTCLSKMHANVAQYGRSAMDARVDNVNQHYETGSKVYDRSMLEAVLFSFLVGKHNTLEDACEKAGLARSVAATGHQVPYLFFLPSSRRKNWLNLYVCFYDIPMFVTMTCLSKTC